MQKTRDYHLSEELLRDYMKCSLKNAEDLLTDATILLSKMRYARAYFLACASIEETGKAYSAFSAIGRNLNNPGTVNKIKMSFDSHRDKIISALVCYLATGEVTKERIEHFLGMVSSLEAGREQSMYVDVNKEKRVTVPEAIVRPIAAVDAIRLAKQCLVSTSESVLNHNPPKSTPSQDKFMCLGTKMLAGIFETQDFWEFCMDHMNTPSGLGYLEMSVKYHDEYFLKKKLYAQEKK
jgi:AbiV family abortive infection protein